MKENHILIQELLPLYIDQMLSEETKKIIESHVSTCNECQELLHAIRAELQESTSNTYSTLSADEQDHSKNDIAFIHKLKRLGMLLLVAGGIFTLLFSVGTLLLGKEITEEQMEEEKLEHDQELLQVDNELVSLSPSQEAIFKQSGVTIELIEKYFSPEESRIRYRYTWTNPNIDYVQEDIYWPNHLIAMDLTNNQILKSKDNTSSFGHTENVETWTLEGIEENTETIGIELPNLAIFFKPKEFKVPLEDKGVTWIKTEVTINNVRFFIEKAEVKDSRVLVYYQQIDNIQDVGLYELSFNIIDRDDQHWSKEPNIDFQMDAKRTATIPIVVKMNKPFTLHLEHAVQIVPGIHYKFTLKS